MSMYRGHLVGGFAAYLVVIVVWGIYTSVFQHYFPGLIAALAGSLFPDIDIYSKGQRLFLKILFLLIIFSLWMQAALPVMVLLIFSALPVIFPHRGLFHDVIFTALIVVAGATSLVYVMPHNAQAILGVAFFFFIGVLSHLVLDKGVRKTFYVKRLKKTMRRKRTAKKSRSSPKSTAAEKGW